MKKLLLHSCCAPCSSYVLEYLSNHFDIVPTKWIFLPQLPINERGKIDVENLKRTLGTKISLPLVLKNELSQNEIKLELI